MAEHEAEHVEAEAIDVPEVISGADRWLAEQRAKVAEIAAEYVPHEIVSQDDYRESKRARAQANKARKAVEEARRQQVGAIKDAVRDFEAQVRDLLEPLSSVDADYKAALAEWERLVVDSRAQEVRCWYEEELPEVAGLVPFRTLWDRWANERKWDLYGTNEEVVRRGVADAAADVTDHLRTIDGMGYPEADAMALRSEYLRSLDFDAACRRVQADREQRARIEAAEAARREREAEAARQEAEFAAISSDATERPADAAKPEISAPQARGGESSADAHERILSEVAEAVAAPDPGDDVPPIAFVAYVTEAQRDRLVAFCKGLGIGGFTRPTHGRRLHFERERG